MPTEPSPSVETSSLCAVAPEPRALRPADAGAAPNRELSWLELNQRVLDEAADPSLPVGERLGLLGTSASNLDEFFRVRVEGLKARIEAGVLRRSPDGRLPREQLAAVSARVHRMVADQYRLWREELRPSLEREHGIRILRPEALGTDQALEARLQFREGIFPLLTPLAHDPSHPFPRLRHGSISIAVQLPRPPGGRRTGRGAMAVVAIPACVPRLVPVSHDGAYVLVEDLVAERVGELFSTSATLRTAAFRVTRNWDPAVGLAEAHLRALASEGVPRRELGAAVRIEVAADAPGEVMDPLARQHGLGELDVYGLDGPLQLQDLAQLSDRLAGHARAPASASTAALRRASPGG